jgi:hypothetical protein
MYVVIGGGLLAGGLFIVVLLTALLQRAQGGPSWLNADLTAMLLCIVPTGLLGLGAGYTLLGLFGDHRPIDLLALVGWLALGAGLLWVLRRRRAALIGTPEGGPGSPGRPDRAA